MQNCLPFDLYLILRGKINQRCADPIEILQVKKVTIHERKIFTIHTQETVY